VPYTPDGHPITTHPRQYGDERTETVDPRTSLRRLSRNPGAFRNSDLRSLLPDPLVASLDAYAREDLRAGLQALADLTDRSGCDHAVRALVAAVQAQTIAYADIVVRGARLAAWDPTDPVAVDLRSYDVLLPEVAHD
jgi:hypothetical protein